jgi:hypothetical protein
VAISARAGVGAGRKDFAFRQGRNLMLYNPATKSSKEILSLEPLDAAAVRPPAEERFSWDNRRLRLAGMEWSASGKELLYVSSGDLFLIHADTAKWEQLSKTPVAEQDAKLSPDGKTVAFRRGGICTRSRSHLRRKCD